MFEREALFFFGCVSLYGVSFLILVVSYFLKKDLFKTACIFVVCGAAFHLLSLLVRWSRLGFFPFIDVYTSVSGCALTGILVFLLFAYKIPVSFSQNSQLQTSNSSLILWGLCILPSVFLLMGFGMMSRPEIKTLSPALQSIWLYLHVTFALVTQGAYFVAATLGILYFLTPHASRLTPYDLLIYRFIALGFVLHAVMVISGAIWAQNAWGRYWGWDPIEIWSLITWLIYGIFLHLRITYKWHGNKVAAYSVCGFLLTIFCYYLVPHVYSGSLHVDTKF